MSGELRPTNGNFRWLKVWGPPAAMAGAAAAGLVSFDLPPWAIKMASDWGPAFLLLLGAAAGIAHYVPRNIVKEFVTAQQDQAVAMSAISHSLQEIAGQGGALAEIKEMLGEIKMDQHVYGQRLIRLEEKIIYGGRREDT